MGRPCGTPGTSSRDDARTSGLERVRAHSATVDRGAAVASGPFFGQPGDGARGRPSSAGTPSVGRRRRCVTPRQTCPPPNGFGRNLRSKTRWFTGFCNSHQVSHFATFFIDARAEISVAESRSDAKSFAGHAPGGRASSLCCCSLAPEAPGIGCRGGLRARRRPRPARGLCEPVRGSLFPWGIDNDPSAGSPTETLLRVLLPLNDKV